MRVHERVLNDAIDYAQKGCAMLTWGITLSGPPEKTASYMPCNAKLVPRSFRAVYFFGLHILQWVTLGEMGVGCLIQVGVPWIFYHYHVNVEFMIACVWIITRHLQFQALSCHRSLENKVFKLYLRRTFRWKKYLPSRPQICPGLNANEIQILYEKHHKVSSLVQSHQNTHKSVEDM